MLVGLMGYCLYLAGIARWFMALDAQGSCFVAFLAWLPVPAVLIALAEGASVYVRQGWLPNQLRSWEENLFFCSVGMLFSMGVVWVALLLRLRRCLPRKETCCESDEG